MTGIAVGIITIEIVEIIKENIVMIVVVIANRDVALLAGQSGVMD
jgi:hypothetical protein